MKEKKTANSRRDFLKLAAVAGPAVAVGSVAGTKGAEAATVQGSGYRRTEHVEKYLKSARF